VQASLWAGACVWLWTACLFVQQRMALDQPWLRLAFILGAVALFTLGSTLVFRTARLRARYAPG
jgi:Sec-independent protein secretion pathway component TatC